MDHVNKYVKKIDSNTCVFCLSPADTRDHIPGKQFFPDPKPHDLVTVPCCAQCNAGHKKDEDYVRGLLCFGPAGVSTAGRSLWQQKLHRTYEKDRGLRRVLSRSMKQIRPITASGLRLPSRLAIEIDWNRVFRVVQKWVRGFYYFEYGEVLIPEVVVKIDYVHSGNLATLVPVSSQLTVGNRGWQDVFLYKRSRVSEQPEGSIWLFYVYQNHEFLAVTHFAEPIKGTA